ncbi:MAG: Bug family tripartite tricarboxylate transporter substrate binding protein [Burkholderiales bacterium]
MAKLMRGLLLAVVVSMNAVAAIAQSYPLKPVRVVMPVASGGIADVLLRAIAQGLSESMAQAFVVENRPGASGIIGTDLVAKAAPDGYVLLFTGQTAMISLPFLKKDIPYDAANGFIPIGMCCAIAQAVVVGGAHKANSIRELVDLARANPGKLTYGSIGNGSLGHIYMEVLKRRAAIDMVHVPYKGAAPGVNDLLGGRIAVMITSPATLQDHFRAGKLRALAVGSARRSAEFPDLPTTAEAGFPGWQWEFWQGMFAPAGTPKEAVARLDSAMARITTGRAFNDKYLKPNGIDAPLVVGAEEFAEFLRNDRRITGPLIEATGIRVD